MRRKRLLKAIGPVICCLGLLIADPGQAGVVVNIIHPVNTTTPSPIGEIYLTGEFHTLVVETLDAQGKLHYSGHFQPVRTSAVDQYGNEYQAVGLTREGFNGYPGGEGRVIIVNNFFLISKGNAPDLKVHEVFELLFDDNGVHFRILNAWMTYK